VRCFWKVCQIDTNLNRLMPRWVSMSAGISLQALLMAAPKLCSCLPTVRRLAKHRCPHSVSEVTMGLEDVHQSLNSRALVGCFDNIFNSVKPRRTLWGTPTLEWSRPSP
jgi:hypothetical protein